MALIHGETRGPLAALARCALSGLAYLYAAGLKLYLLPYRTGLRRHRRLPVPVISVGNLTTGGTGKTPITRQICEILMARGLRPCVLIRGYRGENEDGAAVVSTGERVLLTAKQAGDEAALLARLLPGVPVVAGKDRRKTGLLACDQFQPDALVLDDGMQFYQLYRDLEIVLLNAACPFDNGWTLPRGLLREPKSHLGRANVVILTHADRVPPESLERLQAEASLLAPRAQALTASYRIEGLAPLDRSSELPAEWLAGRRVATLCALGSPDAFEAQVREAGAESVSSTRLSDHAEPTMAELKDAIARACAAGAEAIIVSEKDAVKLPPIGRPLPLLALRARMAVSDESALASALLAVIRR